MTAVDEALKKETDNPTICLLLCKEKDRLSVEWLLKASNHIGVTNRGRNKSSYRYKRGW